MTDNTPLPPVKLAFVIDGTVVDVLHTDDRLAAIFLSQPTIIDVTDLYDSNGTDFNLISWDYNAGINQFIAPGEQTNG